MIYRFDGREPVIGSGTYVSETAQVIGDVRVGRNCYIGHGAILRGDYGTIEIGDETAVEEGVIVHAPPGELCSIGRRVVVGHGAIVHARRIEEWVTIGMGAVVSIRAEVGRGAIVAEGAVVKQEQQIEPATINVGNPARRVGNVSREREEYGQWASQLYVDLAHKYSTLGMERIG